MAESERGIWSKMKKQAKKTVVDVQSVVTKDGASENDLLTDDEIIQPDNEVSEASIWYKMKQQAKKTGADVQSFTGNNMDQFIKLFTDQSFWDKVKQHAKGAGLKVVYVGLLLYYTMQKPNLPLKTKSTILGALGYFILPLDAISDVIPVAGFTDDFTILIGALVVAAMYIDEDIKAKAREQLRNWFGEINEDEIREVESKIK